MIFTYIAIAYAIITICLFYFIANGKEKYFIATIAAMPTLLLSLAPILAIISIFIGGINKDIAICLVIIEVFSHFWMIQSQRFYLPPAQRFFDGINTVVNMISSYASYGIFAVSIYSKIKS